MTLPMNHKAFEVEVIRGSQVESCHTVIAAVFSRTPTKIETYGDASRAVFPRSSFKPIQAMPLITSGAANHFKLSTEELALACASHRGEPIHTNAVQSWLRKIGLDETYLECGTHAPANTDSLYQLLQSQKLPSAIHNNCSGKHTGMLTTAVHLGELTKNYVSLKHPVQQRIATSIEKVCRVQLPESAFGIDGCSIPSPCLPLLHLAEGFCEFASPTYLKTEEAEACQKLFSAFVAHPLLTSGTGQYCSEMMIATKGKVLLKGGAEGAMVAAIPEMKIGIALKTLDGSSRSTELCTSLLLNRLGLLEKSSLYLNPKIHNWNRLETGYLRLKNSN